MGGLNGAGWQTAKGREIGASIRRHARSIRVAGAGVAGWPANPAAAEVPAA